MSPTPLVQVPAERSATAATTATTASTSTAPTPVRSFAEVTPRRAAVIAGIGYVALFVLAVFANFVVIEGMVVSGDAAATVANIAAAPGTFRLGIAVFLLVAVIDVVVAWALLVLLREVAPDRSLLAAWLRVLHSVFLGVALASLYQADHLVSTVAGLPAAGAGATAAQVMLALDTFDAMWLVGLLFFGLHLVAVATLLVGPRVAPRILRVVLIVAGVAYVVDTLVQTVASDYDAIAGVMLALVAVPSVIGEAGLGLWLLARAGRPARSRA